MSYVVITSIIPTNTSIGVLVRLRDQSPIWWKPVIASFIKVVGGGRNIQWSVIKNVTFLLLQKLSANTDTLHHLLCGVFQWAHGTSVCQVISSFEVLWPHLFVRYCLWLCTHDQKPLQCRCHHLCCGHLWWASDWHSCQASQAAGRVVVCTVQVSITPLI